MCTVSVIIPVYNTAPKVLDGCVASLAGLRETDYEAIFVDDGSGAETRQAIAAHAARLPRARVITHAHNRGVSAARNTGMAQARGEFLAFLDSDDAYAPDFCLRLLVAAAAADADVAKGTYAYPHHDGVDLRLNNMIRRDKDNFYTQFCSALYRTALVRRHGLVFPERLHASEDVVFAYGCALCAERIAVDDAAQVIITPRVGSATFAPPDRRTIISHYAALARVIRLAEGREVAAEAFCFVMSSLFSLYARIASRNRSEKVRRFVAGINRRLFSQIRRCRQYDHELFAAFLPQDDKVLAPCLEQGDMIPYFQEVERQMIRHCRNLRRKPA